MPREREVPGFGEECENCAYRLNGLAGTLLSNYGFNCGAVVVKREYDRDVVISVPEIIPGDDQPTCESLEEKRPISTQLPAIIREGIIRLIPAFPVF